MDEGPDRLARGRVARTAPLVGLAGRTAGEAVVAALRRRPRDEEFHARNAERYAECLGHSKGVLMKAGQILSFISVGAAAAEGYQGIYQAALTTLQDDAPPMPVDMVEDVIETELGQPPSRLFAAFEDKPLAAASIGQVHAATLADGRRVAVKVQYPGVEQAIRADLANTQLLATFFQLMRAVVPSLTKIDIRALAREVSDRIGEEVDYRIEAAYQQEFGAAYRGHPFIRIPEVVTGYSSRRVLTTELAEGLRFEEAVGADVELRNRWGEAIFRFVMGNFRDLRLLAADPHPGNYLFHLDGSVTFLDFGCVKRFTAERERDLREIQQTTVVSRDPQLLFDRCVAAGWVDPADAPSPAQLFAWFSEPMLPLMASQPFTYTPEFAASQIHREYSSVGPHSAVLRKLTAPSDYVALNRVDVGMTAVLGAFRATGPWNAIREEWDHNGMAATPFGEQELAFRASRR